ncbi:MAG TPA: arylesterase [Pyrinomonadaceae bacterium]|jgi:acyl-CoA thioesterase-1
MKFFLFGLLIYVLFGLAGCSQSNTPNASAPASSSDAAPAASVAPREGNLPKIVAFGDSLTAGLGLSAAESYPALLQKRLEADGYRYEVVNAGASGDTSATGLRRIDWSLEQGDVRVVILELGANDFLRGQPVSETKKNLSRIIERAQARGADVLLAGMYTPTSAGMQYEREINELFQTLAREHNVALIPFFLEGVAGQEKLNQPDGIHPNAEGTKIVAETVYKYLRPLLDKQKKD